MAYTLKLHRDVEKHLKRIPKKQRARLVSTMRSLRSDPRPVGSIKLDDRLYRIMQGQYRVIYAVFDEDLVVVVCKTARRAKDTYRNLQNLLDRAEGVLSR